MTGISMPEAIVASVAIICLTVFVTLVTLKGMEHGLRYKESGLKNKE
jgi:hypothetical protein